MYIYIYIYIYILNEILNMNTLFDNFLILNDIIGFK